MLATSCAGIASGDGQKRLPPSRKAATARPGAMFSRLCGATSSSRLVIDTGWLERIFKAPRIISGPDDPWNPPITEKGTKRMARPAPGDAQRAQQDAAHRRG